MNKHVETFLTAVAAITIYKLLITTYNYWRYRQDDIDTAPTDFNEYDHAHLNGLYGGY
ncbi:hypothetical protein ACN9U3_03125 [Staphylococcus caprae]|uniref:hypothetical protein n=1 Tax=Staphylococcus caprae TaxID=29380 RepID=UPI003B2267D7